MFAIPLERARVAPHTVRPGYFLYNTMAVGRGGFHRYGPDAAPLTPLEIQRYAVHLLVWSLLLALMAGAMLVGGLVGVIAELVRG